MTDQELFELTSRVLNDISKELASIQTTLALYAHAAGNRCEVKNKAETPEDLIAKLKTYEEEVKIFQTPEGVGYITICPETVAVLYTPKK